MRRVYLITGASGTLGTALCRRLASSHDVIACYRNNVPAVPSQLMEPCDPNLGPYRTQKQSMAGSGETAGSVLCVRADLTNRSDVERLVEVAIARYGQVDVLINSAADLTFYGPLVDLWQSDGYPALQLSLNCVTPVLLASALFHDHWKDQPVENAARNRNVVNISSLSASSASRSQGQGYYAASKAALNMLTLYLALELAPYSVRVNAVCPGRFSLGSTADKVAETVEQLAMGDATGVII